MMVLGLGGGGPKHVLLRDINNGCPGRRMRGCPLLPRHHPSSSSMHPLTWRSMPGAPWCSMGQYRHPARHAPQPLGSWASGVRKENEFRNAPRRHATGSISLAVCVCMDKQHLRDCVSTALLLSCNLESRISILGASTPSRPPLEPLQTLLGGGRQPGTPSDPAATVPGLETLGSCVPRMGKQAVAF